MDLTMTPELNNLNLGCGFSKLEGYWNVDVQEKCNPDQVFDMEQTVWPYEDNFFEKITASNVLQYVGKDPDVFVRILKEMYRVSKDQAEWFIRFPHHRSDIIWNDYKHVRVLTDQTFRMFDQTLNFKAIDEGTHDFSYGIYNNIDLEVYDVRFNLVKYWIEQEQAGMVGRTQLNVNLNTMSNVAELVDLHIRVHKPGRCQEMINTIIK